MTNDQASASAQGWKGIDGPAWARSRWHVRALRAGVAADSGGRRGKGGLELEGSGQARGSWGLAGGTADPWSQTPKPSEAPSSQQGPAFQLLVTPGPLLCRIRPVTPSSSTCHLPDSAEGLTRVVMVYNYEKPADHLLLTGGRQRLSTATRAAHGHTAPSPWHRERARYPLSSPACPRGACGAREGSS